MSAWFRPDSVLLPLFLCAALLLLFPRGQRLRPVMALIGGAVIAVAPITIRNVLVSGLSIYWIALMCVRVVLWLGRARSVNVSSSSLS